uniref:Uncharacterized protein n=1 Tax=Arundo donax TaxID=35708 RepID=A0A0A9F9C0_ARUDO
MPSSLPRASLVCKRWRRLVSDPGFLRRFRARHRRNAPLLGFFTQGSSGATFTPTLEPPDRLPRGRFSLKLDDGCRILNCRHGLVLIVDRTRLQVLVWDPITGDLSRVAFPPGFGDGGTAVVNHGAVLRAASDVQGGEDHSIHFLVALVGNDVAATRAFACVYSSVTGVWSNLISTACPSMVPMYFPSTLVGGSLYWLLGWHSVGILEFDLDKQSLAVIDVPPGMLDYSLGHHCVTPAVGGGLGFTCLSGYNAKLWTRKTDCNGVARWVLGRSIELDKLLSLNREEGFPPMVFGFAEEDNMSFLATNIGIFMVQLESMQFKKPFEMLNLDAYHPFASIYTAGLGIDGGRDGGDLLHNT